MFAERVGAFPVAEDGESLMRMTDPRREPGAKSFRRFFRVSRSARELRCEVNPRIPGRARRCR
jgi:hypothetical protein